MNNSLSVIIPCYNEKKTILEILDRVIECDPKDKEIIIVDDCSTDGTTEIIKNIKFGNIKKIFHEKNYGKGKALRSGFKEATNDIILIQDADLEYDPKEYVKLLQPFFDADADVVYGSRFLGGQKYTRIHYFWHYIANKMLTFVTNIFTNLNMSDMETCYKVFKKKYIQDIVLYENSFGIEPEITIKLAKKKLKFFEVPVSYNGRSYEDGKKIGLKDAFVALYCIFKYSLIKR